MGIGLAGRPPNLLIAWSDLASQREAQNFTITEATISTIRRVGTSFISR